MEYKSEKLSGNFNMQAKKLEHMGWGNFGMKADPMANLETVKVEEPKTKKPGKRM